MPCGAGFCPLRLPIPPGGQREKLVPAAGIEPATTALSRRCSTTELCRHGKGLVHRAGIEPATYGLRVRRSAN